MMGQRERISTTLTFTVDLSDCWTEFDPRFKSAAGADNASANGGMNVSDLITNYSDILLLRHLERRLLDGDGPTAVKKILDDLELTWSRRRLHRLTRRLHTDQGVPLVTDDRNSTGEYHALSISAAGDEQYRSAVAIAVHSRVLDYAVSLGASRDRLKAAVQKPLSLEDAKVVVNFEHDVEETWWKALSSGEYVDGLKREKRYGTLKEYHRILRTGLARAVCSILLRHRLLELGSLSQLGLYRKCATDGSPNSLEPVLRVLGPKGSGHIRDERRKEKQRHRYSASDSLHDVFVWKIVPRVDKFVNDFLKHFTRSNSK